MTSGLFLVASLLVPSAPDSPSDRPASHDAPETSSVRSRDKPREVAPLDSSHDAAPAPETDSAKESNRDSEESVVRVDLNRASVEQLTTLPGIGIKRAQAIVRRREIRRFRRPRDLLRVSGIGRRTFFHLKPLVSVSPPDDASAKERRAR